MALPMPIGSSGGGVSGGSSNANKLSNNLGPSSNEDAFGNSAKKKKKRREKEKEKKDRERDRERPKSKSKEKKEVDIIRKDDAISIKIVSPDGKRRYQMLEPIGKGGFGVVYRGLNLDTASTVAVKRVSLHGIPKEELDGIEMEIQLLQNLDHPNIVKYIDAIRIDDYLNIVIEYMENGSLSALLSRVLKSGQVEEQLVAVYTKQILEGLAYLHKQGVIHRDIKGANILSTKEGVVKLADFGVATKLNDTRKSDSVVGTPYWMAPEIIEMNGQQSSACDIWSVGCTVVELLTGKPPYFDLQQMPALFRIVQDEHPPLPDNVSPALEDFLMQCFQKDPLRRISAVELLNHGWLKNANVPVRKDDKRYPYPVPNPSAPALVVPPKAVSVEPRFPSLPRPVSFSHTPAGAAAAGAASGDAEPAATSSTGSNKEHAFFLRVADDGGDDDDWDMEESAPAARQNRSKSQVAIEAVPSSVPGTGNVGMTGGVSMIKKAWIEKDGDDDDDNEFPDDELKIDVVMKKKKSAAASAPVDDALNDLDGDDVFSGMELESDPRLDNEAKQTKAFLKVLSNLSPKEDEDTVLKACKQLTDMFLKDEKTVVSLMNQHGVIPIMEMLEVPNPNVIVAVLTLVNMLLAANEGDQRFQQSMSLVGLIPAIVRMSSPGFPSPIRHQAANFVRQFCYQHEKTRKMFIACGGLPVLVGFLEEPYPEGRALVFNAIDCIRHVFELTTNPKNDFCRLFCKYGILHPMTRALVNIATDTKSPDAAEYCQKLVRIVYWFSQGDSVVKGSMSKPHILQCLLSILPKLTELDLNPMLKSIRNLAMDSNTLDSMEYANAIPALIPFLDKPFPDHIQNLVTSTMYYLCMIKASRQEQAARSGLIPFFMRLIRNNHPTKQFALPVMFQLASTSHNTRLELKKWGGVSFYLDCLTDSTLHYWRSHALESIANWLGEEPQRVEFVLSTSPNINKLVKVLRDTKQTTQLEKLLASYAKILSNSSLVNKALGRSAAFVDELIHRLHSNKDSNNIRINVLKILTSLYDGQSAKESFVQRHGLVPLLQGLTQDKSAAIVAPLATRLLKYIEDAAQNAPIEPHSETDHKQNI